MTITQNRVVIDSGELNFHCPSCGGVNEVDVFRFKTTEKVYGLVTANVSNETALRCPGCKSAFRTSDLISDLLKLDDQQASLRFRPRVTFVDKFMVTAGWFIIPCGILSFPLFLTALFRIPKAAKGWRNSAFIGALISAVFALLLIVPLIISEMQ